MKKLKLYKHKTTFDESEPVLIEAFYSQESADAVPIDQIVLYPNKEIPVLMLPTGNFRIKAMDKSGKEIGGYKVS